MQNHRSISPPTILDFTVAFDALESALTGTVLAAHPVGIFQADRAGVHWFDIEAPDLRIILAACDRMRKRPKIRAMKLAVEWLKLEGLWSWTPESFVAFARRDDTAPSAGELAAKLVELHDRYMAIVDEDGPMYTAPVELGKLNPVRIGLALAHLARLSGIPLPWIHHSFSEVCARQDAQAARHHHHINKEVAA